MTTNQDFQCGHDNHAGSRFCAVCGAARLRSCRACEAPVQWDARYCGACGARLDERDAVSDQEVVEWTRARRERYGAVGGASMDDDTDYDAADDSDRRRPAGMVATIVVILAVVAGLGYFALTRHTVFLERVPDKRVTGASTSVTQPAPSTNGGHAAVSSTVPPPASTTPAATQDVAVSASSDKPASSSGEQVEMSSDEQGATPSEPPPARTARPEEAQSQDASLPPRAPARENAQAQAEDNREQPRMAAGIAKTSEERMAAFLVDELGRERAAAKALSNASWYDEGRSERAYWRRVADAVNRRGSR